MMGRLATIGLFFASAGMTYLLDTAKDSFDLMLQVGAGTGLLYLVRWFWWRVNAWAEVAAMASSFAVSIIVWALNKHDAAIGAPGIGTDTALLWTIAITTVCWVTVALLGPRTDRQTLVSFYRKVRPFGPGWAPVRREAGMPARDEASAQNIPLALLGWTTGCIVIWTSLFAVGNFLYGRMMDALGLTCMFVASGAVLIWVINRLWTAAPEAQAEPQVAASATEDA